MLSRANRRRIGSDNTWPGFVDALSTLLLVIIFLLSVFVLAQFFLGQALSGRDEALNDLRGRVAELSDLLRLEQQANAELRINVSQLTASLNSANISRDDAEAEAQRLASALSEAERRLAEAEEEGTNAQQELADLRQRYANSQEALSEVTELSDTQAQEIADLTAGITALRAQIASLQEALDASEARDIEQEAQIAELGRRLNTALAGKVAELAEYRSEFYGRLRQVLGNREDIRIEGDRFVFQAELLFASGSADLGAIGRDQMQDLARTLLELSSEIPDDINWILRVDGHTDSRPINNERFPSNWELSAARAISVVQFLINQGVPPDRLAATGFGEFQPIDEGTSPEALARNRRIELRFTSR